MNFWISYGLLIVATLITLLSQLFINSCYGKYKNIRNKSGVRGSDIARYILDKNGLTNVSVRKVTGFLSDHYDPVHKVVNLSTFVYEEDSVASIAVAAHECGHAIQDRRGYFMMRLRSAMVPMVNFSSYAGYFAILLGILFGFTKLIWVGIYFEIAILSFQLVTLPVEIDASKRALNELKNYNIIQKNEYHGSKVMLIAAALTYVASLVNSILQIVRLFLLAQERRD